MYEIKCLHEINICRLQPLSITCWNSRQHSTSVLCATIQSVVDLTDMNQNCSCLCNFSSVMWIGMNNGWASTLPGPVSSVMLMYLLQSWWSHFTFQLGTINSVMVYQTATRQSKPHATHRSWLHLQLWPAPYWCYWQIIYLYWKKCIFFPEVCWTYPYLYFF